MDLELRGKVVLITGGCKGIGLRTARCFVEEGAELGICGRDPAALERAASELREMGTKITAVQADVTNPKQASDFVERCVEERGKIDVLINNVGGSYGASSLLKATDEDWYRTFELNLFQLIRLIRLVHPHMLATGGGAIVNISSISGVYPQLSGSPQYGTSKAAQIFLTECVALELADANIRVNTISPGSIIWPGGGWDQFRKAHPQAFERYVRDGFPMGRLGSPEEVADAIVFLASPRANWINGRNIGVDGLEQPVPVKLETGSE